MGFTATPMMVSEAVSEERQASAQGLLVSVSVAVAAVATLAFTWLYGATDDTTTWLAIAATMLVFGGLGWILSRTADPA
jgi:cyanate permease